MLTKDRQASLRAKTSKVLLLPDAAQSLIDRYCNLQIMGAHCVCPYHINCRLFSRNRALAGKGRPEEIEATAEHFFKRLNTTIRPGDSATLKASLRDYGIGIDCSGFAAWVLNAVIEQRLGKPIWKCLKFPSARSRAVSKFRPIENISAALLTGDRNANRVDDIQTVRPGDLIRALNGGHVIVITEVGLDASGQALYFQYAHTIAGSEQLNGVSRGLVVISRPKGQLADQRWIEAGLATAPALEKIKAGKDDSRITRLKALAD